MMPDLDKKRKGGIHQRLQESRAESQRASVAAEYLLKQYAWGHMSVQELQELASLVLQDMNVLKKTDEVMFPQLEALSKLGSSGLHPNNMSRDIDRYILSVHHLPPSNHFSVPTSKGEEKSQALLPHELFYYLHENHPVAFQKIFTPDGESGLANFWKQCVGTSGLQDQAVHQDLIPQKRIPVALHGDEAPIAGRGKQWCKLSIVFSRFRLWLDL